ncbi:MAG: DUF6108 family protein [Porphyromonadaceae bacterium]|nr:DUF6108 family protein [Porphyromonadaceae bacterium]
MKIKRKILLATILCCCTAMLSRAQNELSIQEVFTQYGKQRGVIMVELRGESFDDYEFSLFKSITVKDNAKAVDFIRQCIEKDRQNAKKIKEVTVNGVVQSVFLELPKHGKVSRVILFNEYTKLPSKVTLVYIESETESDDILKVILKKK